MQLIQILQKLLGNHRCLCLSYSGDLAKAVLRHVQRRFVPNLEVFQRGPSFYLVSFEACDYTVRFRDVFSIWPMQLTWHIQGPIWMEGQILAPALLKSPVYLRPLRTIRKILHLDLSLSRGFGI